ncbi:hypothetical protein DCAR_0416155 [Daucus carota subsp. sativus]|uniref:HhH-GPD domain-containing protein n=1 Tax=Daucus carota subsp. sativus TaxID=79200 RepID=A0AAF0WY09_DAUCS|nr:hypothetical protein DCAR_0416155 [Daucus carota subsp. sativus]
MECKELVAWVPLTPQKVCLESISGVKNYESRHTDKKENQVGKFEDEERKLHCAENLPRDIDSPSVLTPCPAEKQDSRKRNNDGIDLNKKPKQRPKVKKHRPKIAVDRWMPRKIPKSQTPRNSTPKDNRPSTTKNVNLRGKRYLGKLTNRKGFTSTSEDVRGDANSETSAGVAILCKRSLKFECEAVDKCDCVVESCSRPHQDQFHLRSVEGLQMSTDLDMCSDFNVQSKERGENCSSRFLNQYQRRMRGVDKPSSEANTGINIGTKECTNLSFSTDESQLMFSNPHELEKQSVFHHNNLHDNSKAGCLQFYRRTFRVNQCRQNSRKSGPNFPKIFKKSRTMRLKATTFLTMWSIVDGASAGAKRKGAHGRCKQITRNFCSQINWKVMRKGVRSIRKSKYQRPLSVRHEFQIEKPLLNMILPTKEQTQAALADPESFKCVLGLSPIVKSRGKRSKGSTRQIIRQPLVASYNFEQVVVNTHEEIVGASYGRKVYEPQTLQEPQHVERLMDIIVRLKYLNIYDECHELVAQDPKFQGGTLVEIVPPKKRKVRPKLALDSETLRMFKLLMDNDRCEYSEDTDRDKNEWWAKEREVFRGRANSLIARMHLMQGDRRFSKWKGSVVDSIVGVFLTQNVGDVTSRKSLELEELGFLQQFYGAENNLLPYNVNMELKPSAAKRSMQASVSTATLDANVNPLRIPREEAQNKSESIETLELSGSQITSHQNVSKKSTPKHYSGKGEKKKKAGTDWEELRKAYSNNNERGKDDDSMDAVDWEAVRKAPHKEVSDVLVGRGMNNVIAARIKDFLERVVKDHGKIDLEWLRDIPPDTAKDFLLSIEGLGLKSVECVRLLTLHHRAFPVDTNVARVAVRLGWVPLAPLPEELKLHLLESYPLLDKIQMYLFPRLCTLDQKTLYELHYQLITFGKVFCTKKKPNCKACPLKGECKHYASSIASSRLALPWFKDKNVVASDQNRSMFITPLPESLFEVKISDEADPNLSKINILDSVYQTQNCEPIIEVPESPKPESVEPEELRDIEDYFTDDEIPIIRLNEQEQKKKLQNIIETEYMFQEGDIADASTALTKEVASVHPQKYKLTGRLKTVHQVLELPDFHPLLEKFEERVNGDPCPYLLAIWTTTDVTLKSSQHHSSSGGSSREPHEPGMTNEIAIYPSIRSNEGQTIKGTILIPCRTANRGKFPLNGTYFQVNEVFADFESSERPIDIPKEWICNLPRRSLHCGGTASAIFRGSVMEEIQYCFWRGYICLRGFDRRRRITWPLHPRFHISPSMAKKMREEHARRKTMINKDIL